MLSKEQVNQAIRWVEENSVDNDILQKIISENSNTIQQTLTKYTTEYNNMNGKKLKSPMTENVLLYIHQLYKDNPTTFNRYNLNIEKDIVYSDKSRINLPEIIEKIKNENISLLVEKKRMIMEYAILSKKYEELLEEKISKSLHQKGYAN
tara:strand:+ start:115 stop:564 length:450 start_codon:yes stop_codon:yes gene_type:complete